MFAALSHGDAVSAWILMDFPNDVVDNSPPPFVTENLLQSERDTAEAPNRLDAMRLTAEHVHQIFADGFESGYIS
jgi:hypothetical protein